MEDDLKSLALEASELHRQIMTNTRITGPGGNTIYIPWAAKKLELKDILDRLCAALGVENAPS